MNYLNTANSWIMWVAVIPAVAMTFIQAMLFTKKSISTGLKVGITKDQFKRAAQASALGSIGPAIVIAVGCLVLIAAIGGPMAWMRLAYIGSVSFELMAANFGATAAGATLGGEGMDLNVFSVCCWTMCISCLGWIIVSGLFTDKMTVLRDKVSSGDPKKLAILSAGCAMGAYMYMSFNTLIPAKGAALSIGNVAAILSAMIIRAVLVLINSKKPQKWINTWGMTISMFAGMIIGAAAA